jgi:hypothetical protein
MCQHNKEFDAWWSKQVGGSSEWSTLERLAAKDAWETVTKANHSDEIAFLETMLTALRPYSGLPIEAMITERIAQLRAVR